MAFPTTSVIDTFTGADENPLATNWTCPLYAASSLLQRLSNQVTDDGGAAGCDGYWDLATFGPDSEAYLTIATKSATTDDAVYVYARVINPGVGTLSGYRVGFYVRAVTDEIIIDRIDNEVATQLGAAISQEFAAGDGMGIECSGSNIAAYHRVSGTWSQKGTRADATYSASGRIGIHFQQSISLSYKGDDFGGGTIVSGGGGKTGSGIAGA